jgi:hypothetical protein
LGVSEAGEGTYLVGLVDWDLVAVGVDLGEGVDDEGLCGVSGGAGWLGALFSPKVAIRGRFSVIVKGVEDEEQERLRKIEGRT